MHTDNEDLKIPKEIRRLISGAQTRHRFLATLRRYIRLATAFDENAASLVGL
jgi:hypothetical protein